MSELIVMGFDDMFQAHEVLVTLQKMEKEQLIDLEDAAIVTCDRKQKIHINQQFNLVKTGAVSGGFWGLLIGALLLNPLAGVAVGAASGALVGKVADFGIDDDFIKTLGKTLKPRSSALFILVKKATPDKVIQELKRFKGKIIHTSLPVEAERQLEQKLKQHEIPITLS